MPSNTPGGLPYPLPTEPVAEGAQAIRNLAEAVDSKLIAPPRRAVHLTGGYRGTGVVADGTWHWIGSSGDELLPAFLLDPADFGAGLLFTQIRFGGLVVADAGNGCQGWTLHVSASRPYIDQAGSPWQWTTALPVPPAGASVDVFDSGWLAVPAPGNAVSVAALGYLIDYVGAAPGPIHLGLGLWAR